MIRIPGVPRTVTRDIVVYISAPDVAKWPGAARRVLNILLENKCLT